MIQDLHSHTYYSFCGQDRPELTVEAAIAGGVELFGICDHNYGIGMGMRSALRAPIDVVPNEYYPSALQRYYDHINLIREKYADRIRVLRGIEIATNLDYGKVCLPDNADISFRLDSEYGIMTRCGLHCAPLAHKSLNTYPQGTVRFAFGGFNTEDDVNYAVSAIRDIIGLTK
jgi:selenocysteine lyase/cysteine desulfurase